MDLEKKSPTNEFIVRYSNSIKYYIIWFGGALSIASSTLLFKDYNWDKLFNSLKFIDHNLLGYILLLCIILFNLIMFIVPFIIALFMTDKEALVRFTEKYVEINKGNRTTNIFYKDIEQIKFVNVKSQSKGKLYLSSKEKNSTLETPKSIRHNGWGYGPYLYRVLIYTPQKKYKIHCSFKEAWLCRHRKTQPTVYTFTKTLEKYSQIAVKYTINLWG